MDYVNYIKSDLFRYAGKIGVKEFIYYYAKSEGFRFSVWLRLCYFMRLKKSTKYTLFPICIVFYKHYKYKFGYDISYSCEIGPGLLLFHISGIVLAPLKIGKNATISQCTTIGMTISEGVKQYPIIGDNVYLAPGSKVIGGVSIGNNVAIGSNCVVNKSIPENAVVVGIPARIVSFKGARDYINNPV